MLSSLYPLVRPMLFSLDAERAHHLTLRGLRMAERIGLAGLIGPGRAKLPAAGEPGQFSSLDANGEQAVELLGLHLPNRVGLAAGLDKDGACIDGLAALGFGFIEIGTVTPKPQPGNPQPRMFRLPQAQTLINRLGFNNVGVDAFVANVRASRFAAEGGVLGLNIGKNATTPIEQAADDYLHCLEKVYPYASYVTVNISSPNTKNLRQLQDEQALDTLLGALRDKSLRLADENKKQVPMVLKIAPDLDAEQVKAIAALLLRHKIDGVIATNTTISHEAVAGLRHSEEAGGLSGAPVREKSDAVVRGLRAELGKAVAIVGTGGILSGADAQAKRRAGADLVQVYTGLIYRGPALVTECVKALRVS
ncbi:MAG: quinone-dependent dihydroorotate dehydrogenase [Candidatus Protistobacter heckmanni]|nr:quinone-dependent dihydroorotate dehydrogenase [Candidatus Protistobacter heckmanni]